MASSVGAVVNHGVGWTDGAFVAASMDGAFVAVSVGVRVNQALGAFVAVSVGTDDGPYVDSVGV